MLVCTDLRVVTLTPEVLAQSTSPLYSKCVCVSVQNSPQMYRRYGMAEAGRFRAAARKVRDGLSRSIPRLESGTAQNTEEAIKIRTEQ